LKTSGNVSNQFKLKIDDRNKTANNSNLNWQLTMFEYLSVLEKLNFE